MPLDEEPLNIFDNNKTSKSLTRKRTMSIPNLVRQSKVERTLSKRSKSLGSLLKSNGAYSSNYNSVYSYIYSSISINLKNANIENKYYIDFIRQRHAKIGKNHKKILDILDLNSDIGDIGDTGDIRLKEKVINTPKRLSGTLKKKSISKSYIPTSIMAF
jgi:hypothetical protein